MTSAITSRHALSILTLFFVVAVPLTDCRAATGKAELSAKDGELVLQVSLPKPPPVNLIARLQIHIKTKIAATSPKAVKIDAKKSMVKWLVKNPSSGQLRLTVKTSPPVPASSASAVITYRNPGDGSTIKIKVEGK